MVGRSHWTNVTKKPVFGVLVFIITSFWPLFYNYQLILLLHDLGMAIVPRTSFISVRRLKLGVFRINSRLIRGTDLGLVERVQT